MYPFLSVYLLYKNIRDFLDISYNKNWSSKCPSLSMRTAVHISVCLQCQQKCKQWPSAPTFCYIVVSISYCEIRCLFFLIEAEEKRGKGKEKMRQKGVKLKLKFNLDTNWQFHQRLYIQSNQNFFLAHYLPSLSLLSLSLSLSLSPSFIY